MESKYRIHEIYTKIPIIRKYRYLGSIPERRSTCTIFCYSGWYALHFRLKMWLKFNTELNISWPL